MLVSISTILAISRTLPTAASSASDPLIPIAPRSAETLWLEPFPDSWLASAQEQTENPEARYTRYESVSLAFLTALQVLPPRQRIILLLSDVLDWRASEIAHLFEVSVGAVKSALRRARVTLEKNYRVPMDSQQWLCIELMKRRGPIEHSEFKLSPSMQRSAISRRLPQ
ncbi:hypothetical protein KSF_001230 [Reticulibacter mediterranei]|uniref:RNA polymerase sigma factor 70 region 4 type 2 domain-containing protein n=1 Tax=Reticulibacter mediterranei TaxID=2778369 RepID=A0A8J3IG30_9CHLR|nr:sigma factor-like helix-turn-helix DNA-binding protein [Reticulibacter mediterranei]GHO90075.1 hypothetical protein KSF_001230 [Reticulibacter mediterranei]